VYRERLLTLPPADAARTIVDGVERGKPRIRVGRDAVVIDLLTRLAPATASRLTVAFERKVFGATSDAAEVPAHPHAGVVRYDGGE
jgi:hypothetical protein